MARPKTFDRAEVLDKAMQVFWEQGFEQTSIEDLAHHMGISRSSLYDTFGSKDALMFEAMDCYVVQTKERIMESLQRPGPARSVIRDFFSSLVEVSFAGHTHSCLVTKSAMMTGRTNQEIMDRVCAFMNLVEDAFRELIERGRRDGELNGSHDPRALARFFVNAMQGISVTGCARAERQALQDVVQITLSVLD